MEEYVKDLLLHFNLGVSVISVAYMLYVLVRESLTRPEEYPIAEKNLTAVSRVNTAGMFVLMSVFVYRYYILDIPFGNEDALRAAIASLINLGVVIGMFLFPVAMLSYYVGKREDKKRIRKSDARRLNRQERRNDGRGN